MHINSLPRSVWTFVAIVSIWTASVSPAAAQDYGGYRPSYQGFGVNTPGGRGGTICRVTSLHDELFAGPGTLRYCVERTSVRRIVIFEISGTINLESGSPLTIREPYITIAGQTSPSPGIAIRGPGVIVNTHDVVLQHLRIRVGQLPYEPIGLWFRDDANNVVADHISVSWGVWDTVAIGEYRQGHPPGDVTLIDSIVSESLACSGVNSVQGCDGSGRGSNSRGIAIGDGWGDSSPNVALVRNLVAHHNDRNPEVGGRTKTMFVNNLIYNPSLTPYSAFIFEDAAGKGAMQSVMQGNLVVSGPTTPGNNGYVAREYPEEGEVRLGRIDLTVNPSSRIYMDGNYYEKHCANLACLASGLTQWSLLKDYKLMWQGISVRAASAPFSLPSLPLSSALPYNQVESYLAANAGARPLDRDATDRRIVNELRSRSGSVPNSPSEKAGAGTDGDGFAVLASNRRTLSVPASPNQVVDGVGRTRVEQWLEGYARELEPATSGGASAPSSNPPATQQPSEPAPVVNPPVQQPPSGGAAVPMSRVTLSSSISSPRSVGTTVTWTATPVGGTAPYRFKWFVFDGNMWWEIGDWTSSSTFAWQPTYANSQYVIGVWSMGAGDTAEHSAERSFVIR